MRGLNFNKKTAGGSLLGLKAMSVSLRASGCQVLLPSVDRFLFLFNFNFSTLFIWVLFPMYVCTPHVCLEPAEGRRGHQVPRDWRYKWW